MFRLAKFNFSGVGSWEFLEKAVRILLPVLVIFEPALANSAAAQTFDAPQPQSANIVGTVTDVNNGTVPGATVVLKGPRPNNLRTVVANDKGFFEIHGLQPGVRYRITASAKGFENWTSPVIVLKPGQYEILTGARLRVAEARTTVNVKYSSKEIATQQVAVEEQQRLFGFIPNFYVVYNSAAQPMTAKLKFRLALRVATDPITFAGVAFLAGIEQAAHYPNYGQGIKGYGERFGSTAATGTTDIFIGGAILPSLLHQDPRYFYKGTGTKKSRALYALRNPFVCKGDNGSWQPNYSTMGGDLAASAIANLYRPASNGGTASIFENFAISTGERMAASLVQEFLFRKLTKIKGQKK